MTITLKPVRKTDEDGLLIMHWRNDPDTRKMSYNSEPKKWETFEPIFKNSFFSNYVKPVFACEGERKIAFVGFVGNSNCDEETSSIVCKVGINVDPQRRGRGLGSTIISTCIEHVSQHYPLTKKIIAEIKPENTISKKLFERCKFRLSHMKTCNGQNMLVYEYDIAQV
jgi:RimJ/RimL family protein N-acetyltransferase